MKNLLNFLNSKNLALILKKDISKLQNIMIDFSGNVEPTSTIDPSGNI